MDAGGDDADAEYDSDNEGDVSHADNDPVLSVANVLATMAPSGGEEANANGRRNTLHDDTVQKLIGRLTPYAQSLPGTAPPHQVRTSKASRHGCVTRGQS